MARYIVNNSRFRPFEFQEMLAPVLAADTAHKELEDQIGELRTKASVWENMANKETDPYAYNLYQTYSKDLQSEAQKLSDYGLTPQIRSGLKNMHERYGREILPIEQAYQSRQEHMKQQQDARLKDQTLRFNRDAGTTSLDDYIRNPSLSFIGVSGANLMNQVAAGAEALSKEIRENPDKYRSVLGGQHFEVVSKKGFTAEEINQAIVDPQNANPLLVRLVDDVMRSSGTQDFDPKTQMELRSMAAQGLYRAQGNEEVKYLDNWMGKLQAQEAMQKRLLNYKGEKVKDGDPETPQRAYSLIPKSRTNKEFIRQFGGKALQGDLKTLDDIERRGNVQSDKLDLVIQNKINDNRKGSPQLNKGLIAQQDVIPNLQRQIIEDPRFESNEDTNNLAGLMIKYNASSIGELRSNMERVARQTATTTQDIKYEVTNTGPAMKQVLERVNGYHHSNGSTGISKITKRGERGKEIGIGDAKKLFNDKDAVISLQYDTDLDEYVIIKNGEGYIINPSILGPEHEVLVSYAKRLNPSNVEIQPGQMFNFGAFDAYNERYSNILENIGLTMGSTLNEFTKTQPQ